MQKAETRHAALSMPLSMQRQGPNNILLAQCVRQVGIFFMFYALDHCLGTYCFRYVQLFVSLSVFPPEHQTRIFPVHFDI